LPPMGRGDNALFAGESCGEMPAQEIRAEIVDATQPLEKMCQQGKLVPLPKPGEGQRVKVTVGLVCVFVEADGQMVLWDANEGDEQGIELRVTSGLEDGLGEP